MSQTDRSEADTILIPLVTAGALEIMSVSIFLPFFVEAKWFISSILEMVYF